MVERALPWYDPSRQVERDQRKDRVADKAFALADRIREDYRHQDERMAGRR